MAGNMNNFIMKYYNVVKCLANKSLFTSKNSLFSSTVIVLISLIFALMIGSGMYGYGNDYYSSYYRANFRLGGFTDRLGYILATLSINGIHVGVQIVTFILSLSAGFLLREHIKFKESYSFYFFILLYLISIHTWQLLCQLVMLCDRVFQCHWFFWLLWQVLEEAIIG